MTPVVFQLPNRNLATAVPLQVTAFSLDHHLTEVDSKRFIDPSTTPSAARSVPAHHPRHAPCKSPRPPASRCSRTARPTPPAPANSHTPPSHPAPAPRSAP